MAAFFPSPPSTLLSLSSRPPPRCTRCTCPSVALLPSAAATAATAALLVLSPVPPTLALQPTSQVQSAASATFRINDGARIFTTGQAARLTNRLENLERDTGLRLIIVTTRGESSHNYRWTTPPANTVIVGVDSNAGNILSFSTGEAVVNFGLPPNFWVEAANRFGNVFAVRDAGIDGAVERVIDAVENCAKGGKVCRYVPGLSEEQWKVSAVSGAVGGCIAGAACRTGGRKWNWPFVVLFSPLWGIFGVSFGVGPVMQRVDGAGLEVVSVVIAFALCAAGVWLWVPWRFGTPGEEET